MALLKRTVFVRDPAKHRDVILRAGEEPAPEYAALVTNPDAWQDGQLPDQSTTESSDTSDDNAAKTETKQAAPAAKKTAAKKTASAPARGRNAAGEGDSGK
ncbi:hypothetical protein [Streptomyces sp. NPDC047868]|uniref:hypothetical protein n=1 Tax=Streptomyces sp. NPDC047868 TaxID=3155480 RepID=UPI0034570E0C